MWEELQANRALKNSKFLSVRQFSFSVTHDAETDCVMVSLYSFRSKCFAYTENLETIRKKRKFSV